MRGVSPSAGRLQRGQGMPAVPHWQRAISAALGKVRPLAPSQIVEIARSAFCASLEKPMIAEQSTSLPRSCPDFAALTKHVKYVFSYKREFAMKSYTSLDLQQRTGDIQRAAIAEPVIITNHGRPRLIISTVEEFARLKVASGESLVLVPWRKPRCQEKTRLLWTRKSLRSKNV
jgi:hypothetical protein